MERKPDELPTERREINPSHEELVDTESKKQGSPSTLTKFVVEIEVELYEPTPQEALKRAVGLLKQTLDRFQEIGPQILRSQGLPTGGVSGEPHKTAALEGWKCLFTIREAGD